MTRFFKYVACTIALVLVCPKTFAQFSVKKRNVKKVLKYKVSEMTKKKKHYDEKTGFLQKKADVYQAKLGVSDEEMIKAARKAVVNSRDKSGKNLYTSFAFMRLTEISRPSRQSRKKTDDYVLKKSEVQLFDSLLFSPPTQKKKNESGYKDIDVTMEDETTLTITTYTPTKEEVERMSKRLKKESSKLLLYLNKKDVQNLIRWTETLNVKGYFDDKAVACNTELNILTILLTTPIILKKLSAEIANKEFKTSKERKEFITKYIDKKISPVLSILR